MEYSKRKPLRLPQYDYAAPGGYFVTICTEGRRKILSNIVGEGLCALPEADLTPIGTEVEKAILHMETAYESVSVDSYVIMPNHVHLVLMLHPAGGHGGPPLHQIIGRFKSYTTHLYGGQLWQRSFYDHVIRNEEDLRSVREYIAHNPARWWEDELYTHE